MGKLRVRIDGDKAYRAALSKAGRDAPQTMDEALEAFGRPVFERAVDLAPKLTGELAGSGSFQVAHGEAVIFFSAEHAPVLEFARYDEYESLTERYGAPPRFAYRALWDAEAELEPTIEKAMEPVTTIDGWAQ